MFSLFSGVYDSYFAPTKLNLLIVGPGGVGKTALLERLKCTQFTKNKKVEKQQVAEYLQREVPGDFLPPRARGVAHSNFPPVQPQQQAPPNAKQKGPTKKEEKKSEPKSTRLGFLKCPAPSRYQNAQDSDDSDNDNDDKSIKEEDTAPPKPTRNGMSDAVISQESMQDVSLVEEGESSTNKEEGRRKASNDGYQGDDDQQCDVKPKSKMLPLHKIRPTIGMNLGKVEICGAQCHVWDLGGKMHDLWSRYYQDCDAVIFVWKIVEDVDANSQQQKKADDDSDDSDEDYPFVTAAEQLKLLEQVRESIPDDIPFLIWGHWFPCVPRKNKMYTFNEPYSTGSVLPHYHNPLMSLYFGSAKSGAGVRCAMEWLIPIAARQKRFREKAAAEAKEEETASPNKE